MYIPKAKKLPSGSWRVRVTVPGQDKPVSITRPTKREAEREAAAIKAGAVKIPAAEINLAEAMEEYITAGEGKISPATTRRYRQIQKNRFRYLRYLELRKISRQQWQEAVDEIAKDHAPKTVKNEWRFISSVLRAQGIEPPNISLEKVIPPDLHFLTYEEIPRFLEAAKGTEYEIAALLALSSLRASEALNVTRSRVDLEKGCIYVQGSAVVGPNGLVHKDDNKNATSRRVIPFILPQLREAIEAGDWRPEEYLVQVHPNSLWKAMHRISEEAGVTPVGMHDLRRTFVALAVHQGLNLEAIRKIGGWANDTVIRQVYLKICDKDMEAAGDRFTAFFQ